MRDPLKMRGYWRASVREADEWREWRPATGPYRAGDLLEWGSITKGIVGTTAATLLDPNRPLSWYAPEYPNADYTIGDLVQHRSGLPRLPAGMGSNPLGQPYRATIGQPISAADAHPAGPRGTYCYSNIGYALLGVALDRVCGSWFDAATQCVLEPAGITSATIAPETERRILAPLWFGRAMRPWEFTGSPYAATGGVWSTFEDLCRYADWALQDVPEPGNRRVSWQQNGPSTWINGEVRAAGAIIASASGVTAVVHALDKAPHAPDKIAEALIRQTLLRARNRA